MFLRRLARLMRLHHGPIRIGQVADEPTGNLDSTTGNEILSFMRTAVDDYGQTTVMVTHDPYAAAFADRVVFLAEASAARAHPDLREAVRNDIATPIRNMFRQHLTALLGPTHPLIDLLADVVPGVVILRAAVLDETVSADTLADNIAAVVSAIQHQAIDPRAVG